MPCSPAQPSCPFKCGHTPLTACPLSTLIHTGPMLARWQTACAGRPERLASGSDDFTMFLWEPSSSNKPLGRMTGHLQLINHVRTTCCHKIDPWSPSGVSDSISAQQQAPRGA